MTQFSVKFLIVILVWASLISATIVSQIQIFSLRSTIHSLNLRLNHESVRMGLYSKEYQSSGEVILESPSISVLVIKVKSYVPHQLDFSFSSLDEQKQQSYYDPALGVHCSRVVIVAEKVSDIETKFSISAQRMIKTIVDSHAGLLEDHDVFKEWGSAGQFEEEDDLMLYEWKGKSPFAIRANKVPKVQVPPWGQTRSGVSRHSGLLCTRTRQAGVSKGAARIAFGRIGEFIALAEIWLAKGRGFSIGFWLN